MSNEQDQPLNNPFQNLDKSQYRDARQERRPAPVKLKKAAKAKNALEDSAEDDIFAGLMRDSGVAPLGKGKHKAAPVAKTAAPALLPDQEPAPAFTPTPNSSQLSKETPQPSPTPPSSNQPGFRGSPPDTEKAEESAGCGQPRRGASENHVFRAASPECRTGSATEGYMIKTQAKTTFFAQRALSASSGEAALGERVSKRALGMRSAERSHRTCDRRVCDKRR